MWHKGRSLVDHGCFHPIFYDNVKKYFKNLLGKTYLERMKLLELPVLKSRNLNLKACAFKSLIVLLLCYNILFYFDLYSSLAVTNRLCIYILLNINIEKLKIKAGIAKLSHLLSEAVVRRYSVKKGVLRNFTKFTGKHLCQSLFFNKAASLGLQLC